MSIQSVDRALQILFAFGVEDRLLGVSELSHRLGLTQATTHRLARSLTKWGLLEQDPASRRYRLAVRLIELGGTMLQGRGLTRTIQPYLYHISETLHESAYLGILVEGDVLNLQQVGGPQIVQYDGWLGRRTPFHCASTGKVLAAYLPEERLQRLLAEHPLTPYTANTITDLDTFHTELARVREQGFATSIGELDPNMNAIAVPVKRVNSTETRVIAAIGVAGPTYRFTEKMCLDAAPFLTVVGNEVSARLMNDEFNYPVA
jgi:DNA-binding IclR family transcriptional regulator